MSNKFFRFRQFTVWHDRCAMKVGTDGVLLGAWCPVHRTPYTIHYLDIGTGSGLIALMLAQRCPEANIDAIDIDADAVLQAQANFEASPWKERLHVHLAPLQEWNGTYDLIVSNPPYFNDSLKNPDRQRQTARHTDSLGYGELVHHAARLLGFDGMLALILPAEAEETIIAQAAAEGLFPTRLTQVCSKPSKPAKRIMAAFVRNCSVACERTTFCIESATSPRSEEYSRLTQDFYL